MNTIFVLAWVLAVPPSTSSALTADKTVIEMGDVKAGPLLTRRFTLRNTANTPIVITSLDSTCGCLRRTASKTTLAVGESTDIIVTINTLTQPAGEQTWRTEVKYQAANEPIQSLELRLTAKLQRELTLSPPMLSISTATTATTDVTLTDSRRDPLTIIAVQSTSPHLTINTQHETRHATRFTVTIAEGLPTGTHDEFIVISTSDPEYSELRVPVRIVKHSPDSVVASPSLLNLSLGSNGVGLVQLRRADRAALTIASATCATAGVRVTWANGVNATLRVSVDPVKAGTSGRAELHVVHDRGEIRIPVQWDLQ